MVGNVINSHNENNTFKLYLFFNPPKLREVRQLVVNASEVLLDDLL